MKQRARKLVAMLLAGSMILGTEEKIIVKNKKISELYLSSMLGIYR